MTNDEIVAKLKELKDVSAQVDALRQARIEAEAAIAADYKVDECNEKRRTSAIGFQDKIDVLVMQAKVLQTSINEALQ